MAAVTGSRPSPSTFLFVERGDACKAHARLERLGVKESVVGTCDPDRLFLQPRRVLVYLTLAVVFIAQATNTPLSFGDLLLVLGISLITSKGAHSVPGSAIVILAATLNAVLSIPAIGLVVVLSVDWFIGMARARQPDRQLRRHRRRCGMGRRPRPRQSAPGAGWR
jgi:hypothetical protein